METNREWAEHHLHNQDRIIDELHAKHKAALLLLKEFVEIYLMTGYQRAYDDLHDRALDMLEKEGVEVKSY